MDNYAALQWQWEMGATDFVGEMPHDWFIRNEAQGTGNGKKEFFSAAVTSSPFPLSPSPDLSCITTLSELREALQNFEGLSIKRTATQLVFGVGVEKPRVAVVGEAPGADEDRQGLPFVGAAGKLLDKMLAAIDLSREKNTYITNVINWRPPGNRQPTPQEIALSLPFLQKHIELLNPEFLLIAGGTSAKALFNLEQGITRTRGHWYDYVLPNGTNVPALITFHPAYLLRAPAHKALAWKDLLSLRQKLFIGDTQKSSQ